MAPTTDADHVTVRMYNVGFGDAFLLLFPGPDRPLRVLIDCGSHASGPGPRPIAEVVDDIVADVTDADGVPRIDLVVATHRHRDHVSGFAKAAWARVEVGEVWMPWTEDPVDSEARRIRERQSSTAAHLAFGLRALGATEDEPALQLAENSLTNADAMETLHHGFATAAPRRFLPRDRSSRALKVTALPKVRVHVLGPSRDPHVIRDMNPPPGAGYLRLAGGGSDEPDPPAPFPGTWEVQPEAPDVLLPKRDRDRIGQMGQTDPLALAVALEQAVNGTSLVLMFEVGRAFLLFPGDAQWGTWKALLDDPVAMELLMRTTFLKVGHHGSHNATPRPFIEALAAARAARESPAPMWGMVSTRPIKMWPEIPKAGLIDALAGLTPQLARSDAGDRPPASGFSHWDDAVIEAVVPLS